MKNWFLIALSGILLLGCNEEAKIPVYLYLPEFEANTNYSTQGTASQDFTTGWLYVNGDLVGAYEVPTKIPIITEGNAKIDFYPGVNLNGQASFRYWYDEFAPYQETFNFQPGESYELNSNGSGLATVQYKPSASIKILEDFESTGLNLEPSGLSDTVILKTNAPGEVFQPNIAGEEQDYSGKMVVGPLNIGEVATISEYDLPKFGANVILEIHYKTNINFTVGLYVDLPSQVIQTPVVTVYPTTEWKKMYINLVTEVSAYPNASSFKIFVGAINPYSEERTVFIDNMKLIY